jgi:hypothetical protein
MFGGVLEMGDGSKKKNGQKNSQLKKGNTAKVLQIK